MESAVSLLVLFPPPSSVVSAFIPLGLYPLIGNPVISLHALSDGRFLAARITGFVRGGVEAFLGLCSLACFFPPRPCGVCSTQACI